MARFVAVLPAGGLSQRIAGHAAVQAYKSKLLVPIFGKPVFARTLEAFKVEQIFQYVVVPVPANLQADFLPPADSFPALNLRFIPGGASRQRSVFNALKFIYASEDSVEDLFVLVHDAARCFVTPELLRKALFEVQEHAAVSAAVPVSDTLVQVDSAGCFQQCLDREVLRAVQTPQAFKFDLLYQAHQQAKTTATDDASLVAAIAPVKYFEGSHLNKKITYQEDLNDAEQDSNAE